MTKALSDADSTCPTATFYIIELAFCKSGPCQTVLRLSEVVALTAVKHKLTLFLHKVPLRHRAGPQGSKTFCETFWPDVG